MNKRIAVFSPLLRSQCLISGKVSARPAAGADAHSRRTPSDPSPIPVSLNHVVRAACAIRRKALSALFGGVPGRPLFVPAALEYVQDMIMQGRPKSAAEDHRLPVQGTV